MSEFVYLYRGGEAGRSPERMQQSMQKWMAWFKELGESGHIKDRGQPLERAGKLVKGPADRMMTPLSTSLQPVHRAEKHCNRFFLSPRLFPLRVASVLVGIASLELFPVFSAIFLLGVQE